MSKQLTEGQRLARATVRAAMREVIRRVDEFDCRRNSIQFTAQFHLSCVHDQSARFGNPPGTNLVDVPVYSGAIERRFTPCL